MRNRTGSLHDWVSRLLAGAATGCAVLLAVDVLVLIPVWGPRLLKPDPRWDTVFFVAKIGLPVAIVLGAVAGLAWPRSREIQLSRGAGRMLFGGRVCLAVAPSHGVSHPPRWHRAAVRGRPGHIGRRLLRAGSGCCGVVSSPAPIGAGGRTRRCSRRRGMIRFCEVPAHRCPALAELFVMRERLRI